MRMKKNYNKHLRTLKKAAIFDGVPLSEFEDLLEALDSQLKYYRGSQIIVQQGSSTKRAGVLLEGSLLLYQDDFWGKRVIKDEIAAGHLFLESCACSRDGLSPVTVQAETASAVLWFNMLDIMRLDGSKIFHTIVIRNLMNEFAKKNMELNEKLTHMEKRTTREKLLSFFSEEAMHRKSSSFDLEMTRAQLAEYLCVDRSAMTSELTRLKKEGWLEADGNHIQLLKKEV